MPPHATSGLHTYADRGSLFGHTLNPFPPSDIGSHRAGGDGLAGWSRGRRYFRAVSVRPPLVWSLLKLQAGCMRLERVCCSCTASAGRLLPALLAVRSCCSGGHHGMAVWPESGKIGIDLSSMIVTEASRVDLTVYGGAGAGHWPRFRPLAKSAET